MNEPRDANGETAAGESVTDLPPTDTAEAPAAAQGVSDAAADAVPDVEATAEASEAEAPIADADALAARVAELEAQLKETEESALRVRAEAENVRKRSQRDVDNARKFALEKFIGELLPVKDSMELGISACDSEGASLDSVREGVVLTDKMFATAMEKAGVASVDPAGEVFNPELHQAVSMVPAAEGVPAGHVMTVIQRGYTLNDRLVRPAMVIVAQ